MGEIISPEREGSGLAPGVLAEPGKQRNYSEAWPMIAFLVWYEDHLSLMDLGTRPAGDLCRLSQAVNRLRKRAETNPCLAGELERLKEDLGQIHICQA